MTITCEHLDSVLSEYLEGDLDAADRRAVDAHLRECLRCAALVRDIESIRRGAATLPPLEPSRDLWPAIAGRIEAPVLELSPRQAAAPRRRTWQLTAAAVVLVAVSSAVTYTLATRGAASADVATTVPAPAPSPAPSGVVTPSPRPRTPSGGPLLVRAEPVAPEVMYDMEISRLRSVLDQRRADLDTATIVAVEKSLKAIDLAIADAKAALAADGQSRFLNDQLNRALEKKLGLLRRVALLPLGAS